VRILICINTDDVWLRVPVGVGCGC